MGYSGSNLLFFTFFSFLHTSKSYRVQDIKNTKYINDTAGSMVCHINHVAYIYKGSFILYAKHQKGTEGHLNSVVVIAKPIWGHANGKDKRQGENMVGSDKSKIGVSVKR